MKWIFHIFSVLSYFHLGSISFWFYLSLYLVVYWHSRQITPAITRDRVNVPYVYKLALTCCTVTFGRSGPESWPAVEREKVKPISWAGVKQEEYSLMISVCASVCVLCVCVGHGTEMWKAVLPVQCILPEIKIIWNLCEWDLHGG